jgi:2-keto-3-deoxy-L-rhamnonate aldolase RhmA
MALRPNPVRYKLLNGGAAFGPMAFEFFTPGLFALAGQAGVDFVILDMEHSGVGADTIKAQLAFARGTGVMPFVRVPGSVPHLIAPILDAGAMGIMVPLVETPEQAEIIVASCRYRPLGRRGLAFSVAHDDYSGGGVESKILEANERTLVIALVESERGIQNVEAIMAVPGVDVGWLGHYDLTDSMGCPGQFERPEFDAAVRALLGACERHGKAAGFLATDLGMARAWRAKGFRCLGFGTDVGLFRDALSAGLSALKQDEAAAAAANQSTVPRSARGTA